MVDSSLVSVLLWAGFVLILAALIVSVALLSRSSRARTVVNVGILLTTIMLLFLAGEVAGRIYHRVVYGIPLRVPMTVYLDRGLGWGGKQAFWNPDTSRFKILVVGDSFTHGLEVPKDQMYYSALGRALNAEIFAYGGGGYGTLQELLVADAAPAAGRAGVEASTRAMKKRLPRSRGGRPRRSERKRPRG